MKLKARWVNSIVSFFPYALLLIAGSGLAVTFLLQRVDLTIFSLVLVIPLVLAAIILLFSKGKNGSGSDLTSFTSRIRFPHLFLINVLLFIISIIALISYETRPLIYFIIVSLSAGVTFLQILCKRQVWTDSVIIFEIVLLSLNLIWSVTLKYPLYFGDTDLFDHLYFIDTILNTTHTESLGLTYVNFPMYHILNAIGIEVTGLSLRTAVFVIMGITWQVGTVVSYLIFKRLSNSSNFSLIACLFFALSLDVIFYGSYSIARSLGFVFCLVLLYLVVDRYQKQSKYVFLTVIIMCALIMTHHLTALFLPPVLVLIYICQRFAARSARENTVIPAPFILLFSVCIIAYLIWVSRYMMDTVLPNQISVFFQTDIAVKSNLLRGYGLTVILGQVYYSFILLFCLLGVRRILDCYRSNKSSRNAYVFALAGFFALVIYLPGPMDLFQQSNLVFVRRFILLVTPSVVCLAAYGIEYLISIRKTFRSGLAKSAYLPILALVLIVPTTFFSLIGTGNAQDCNAFPHTAKADTPYFTKSELKSFSFINEEANTSVPLYSDFQTGRNMLSFNDLISRNIIRNANVSYIENGYVLFRVGELHRRSALSFYTDIGQSQRYDINLSDPTSNILISLSSEDLIYCNGAVQTYIIQNDSASLKD